MIKFGRPVPVDIDERLPRLVSALATDDRLDALWLFGSRARNEGDAMSDVDLAALARRTLNRDALWRAQLDWTHAAVSALETDDVSVQTLNRMPVAVRAPILRDARLLWARTPEVAVDFAATTLDEYLDLKPYLERYDRELFQQARSGVLR